MGNSNSPSRSNMIFEVLQLEWRTGVGHRDCQWQLKLNHGLQAAEDDVNTSGRTTGGDM
jgi:hypothetical protein